jgi:probable rRNA maturation factor
MEVSNLGQKSKETSARALSLFATRAQHALGLPGEVNIYVTSSREMQDLNRRYRRKNKPTDVLSFPSRAPGVAGDIAISLEIAAANAADIGHSLATEVKVLILHGLLHLAGHDHETDGGEMLARETAMRQELKLPVGLIERTHAAAAQAAEAARQPKAAPKKAAARSATVGKKAATSKSKPGSATKSASAETRKRGGRRA